MTEQVEPIRRSVTVRCDPERAFRVFTAEIGRWWPAETHSRAATEFEGEGIKVERIEFQGRVGGHVLEHMSNGRTLSWAEVLAWDPPRRFVLAWRPHSRPQPPTEVDVTFTPRGGGTLVELEHRGWEQLSEDFHKLYADYAGGWIQTLGQFATAVNQEVA
ncbi:MAG: SRPBCC domain-containing protein [Actinomycetota bacterium]